MKYLLRYLSLLFALVMCVGLFSITGHAEEIEDDYVYIQTQVSVGDSVENYEMICYPQNGNTESSTYEKLYPDASSYATVRRTFYVAKRNKSHLMVANREGTVRLENISTKQYFRVNPNASEYAYTQVNSWTIAVYYSDNTVDYISNYSAVRSTSDYLYDLTFTFTPKKDVVQIYVSALSDLKNSTDFNKYIYTPDLPFYLRVWIGEETDNGYALSIEQDSKETGLLNGILGKLTEGFNGLGEKLGNVVNSILDLPAKIWSFIENGLKSLFVPSNEDMEDANTRFDNWAKDTWGGLYQAIEIIDSVYDGISSVEDKTTIEIPSTTINLPDNNTFTFGGWSVKVVPDGFEFLANAVKWAFSCLCTLAFVNGMRKRYESVFGG